MRGEGNHKIPGSFAPENMEKTGAERVKYSLACQHEDAIPIKFVPYAQKCPTVLCTFAVALRKESVDRNLEQLRQKDIQIAEKDKQIAQLMEQAKNYQVLLQAQQVLSLPAPKRSFFKRLFGIHEEKE